MDNTLIPGLNGHEIGTAIELTDYTISSAKKALEALEADYEHNRQHHFPFYQEEPLFIVANFKPGNTRDTTTRGGPSKTTFAWYLVVPNTHITEPFPHVAQKTEELDSAKEGQSNDPR